MDRTCLPQSHVSRALLLSSGAVGSWWNLRQLWPARKRVNVICPGPGCSPLKSQNSGSELIADWKALDLIMTFKYSNKGHCSKVLV